MWDNFKAWANQPFSSDMDAKGWFLFFGFVVCLSIAWGMIFRHLNDALD
jgi:hypothetical protein